jgi:starch-binding outer membrane protein, SusD/RagB family
MKIRKRMALLLAPTVLLLGSCRDVFDTHPLDRVQSGDVWRQEALVRAYMSDLYSRFPFTGFPSRGTVAAAAAGETMGTTPAPTITSDPGGYFDYAYIRAINVFLEEIDRSPLPDGTKNQMKGEAKTLRAVAFFEKQKRYGGVPLVDVVLDPFNVPGIEEKYLRRATEEQIADFVDRELAEAAELLTANHARKGQINRWTALAFKARANLWAASVAKYPSPLASQSEVVGIPAARANDFYQKAAAAADAVVGSGRYALYTAQLPDHVENYRRIFIENGNSEVIFEKLYDGVALGHDFTTFNVFIEWSNAAGGSHVTYDFLLGFEDITGGFTPPALGPSNRYRTGHEPWLHKDPRLFAMTWFQGENYGHRPIEMWEAIDPSPAGTANPSALRSNFNLRFPDASGIREVGRESRLHQATWISQTGLHIKKYIEDALPNERQWERFTETNSWKELRLAEMYLTKAEAEFERGNPGAAAQALNVTRQRAGLPPVEQVGGITRDRVRSEWLSEFALEGRRYWDFRRWRIAEARLNDRTFCGLRTIRHFAENTFYFIPSTRPVEGCEATTRQFLAEHYYNPMTNARRANNPHLQESPGY